MLSGCARFSQAYNISVGDETTTCTACSDNGDDDDDDDDAVPVEPLKHINCVSELLLPLRHCFCFVN